MGCLANSENMWEIRRSKAEDACAGVAIPIFIRNMQYHLTTADVYADGAIHVWEFVDLSLFDEKLRKGWVWPAPPEGGRISIFNLGFSDCVDGNWQHTPQSIRSEVHKALKSLNPDLKGLIDMHGSNVEQTGKVRTMKMGGGLSRPPIKRSNEGSIDFGKEKIPVFVAEGTQFRLEPLFVFADGSLRIGAHEPFVNLEYVKDAFLTGRLTTQVPDASRITIEGLGSFTTARGMWNVKPEERLREIENTANQLKGEQDPIVICRAAFAAFHKDPILENRAALKIAYEAVPEHLRCYCGDMDSKDSLIRRALQNDDNEAADS